MDDATLYILMRTDMKSLNAGKAMAQAAHAGNQVIIKGESLPHFQKSIEKWCGELGFGKTIVLGAKYSEIENIIYELADKDINQNNWPMGWIFDPTYPLIDGETVHYIGVNTCYWIFDPKKLFSTEIKEALSGLKLHK